MITIGITGTIASGKGAVVDILKEKGFVHYSSRAFILEELARRGLEPIRPNMFKVANDLREKFGSDYIVEAQFKKAKALGNNAVIESVRSVGELAFLRKQDNFYLIAVDADPKIRYERALGRRSSTDKVTFEQFVDQEHREMKSVNPDELDVNYCMVHADFKIINEGSKEELKRQVEEILQKIMPK